MEPIRVLVVDDSVVIRRLLTAVLDSAPDIEVVGYSTNGRLALEKIAQLEPDAVSLDVMMPEMDGIECVREIRKTWLHMPVIMFSSITEKGAKVTMEALDAGANDFVTKPWKTDDFADSVGQVSAQLLDKIRALHKANQHKSQPEGPGGALAPRSTPLHATYKAPPKYPTGTIRRGTPSQVEALVIGSSTGGPNALNELFAALAPGLDVPILITQHMPPMFTKLLAERLDKRCSYSVKEAAHGDVVEPGRVYVAPGDWHMRLVRKGTLVLIDLKQDEPVNSCRPAVDPMFTSAVQVYGGGLLAVVLTGMGRDGTDGAVDIAKAGGQIVIQDEASSVVWGMPGAIAETGIADRILPLIEISDEISTRISSKPGVRAGNGEAQ
ncbi:MAG: two-component system chemotaxis response regulator CheB [Planctomycetota bacterium]|jgi:two-component system chemotaxis response regulator CheB